VAIVGGGAAGLSAALVLGRARRRVAVIDAGEPRNAPAAHMYGYLSRDGFGPGQLLAFGREEVRKYGGAFVEGVVTEVVPNGRTGFWVLLADGQRISARRVLVTTGLRDELPDIPGLADRWARDVLHCPYCHVLPRSWPRAHPSASAAIRTVVPTSGRQAKAMIPTHRGEGHLGNKMALTWR
jgi:thioredoxin reductase